MRRALALCLIVSMLLPLATHTRAEEFHAGQIVVVVSSSAGLRSQPSTNSVVLTTLVEGDKLRIISESPTNSSGTVWWNVQVLDGDATGWLPAAAFSVLQVEQDSACWSNDQLTETDGVPQWNEPPAFVIDQEATYIATITTSTGSIGLQLDASQAPIATNNFICLANAGYYDETEFHRVSSDFLIQGGDATGTGTGTPGYVVESDPTTGNYPAGAVAFANAQPNENGAQFFIAVTDLTGEIPDDYPVFGEVISGQDVVAEISHAPVEINPRGELSQPVDPITIQSIEITRQEDEVGPPLPTAETPPATTPRPSPTAEAAPTVSMPPTNSSVIELDAKDIAFVPTEITIDASDEPVTIEMKNTGAALHNFSIDALGIDVDVNPGETVDVMIPAGTAPGSYDFYCNVPGHKEAGMVGTLIVEGSASASTEESQQSCQGFATYTSQFDQAFFDAFDANTAAVRILETSGDSDSWLLTLTPTELSEVAGLIKDIGVNLKSVRPPEYALEWHRLQIESIQLLAEFLDSAGTTGVMMAAITFDTRRTQLEREVRSTLDDPNSCGEFVTWATDESVILDDDLGAVSSVFAPEVMSIDAMS